MFIKMTNATLFKKIYRNVCRFDNECSLLICRNFFSKHGIEERELKLEKAIIVRKVTRYEYEKYILKPNLKEIDLKHYINNKGSNYDFLLLRHQEYAKSLLSLKNAFDKRHVKYKIFQRYNFKPQYINWADALFSLGGDGTFLLAAAMVQKPNKPLIGLNSDHDRSVGFLCLPRKFSLDYDNTLDQILKHNFSWFMRQRIRLKIDGDLEESHFNLYDDTKEVSFLQDISDFEDSTDLSRSISLNARKARNAHAHSHPHPHKSTHALQTILSLNEVFIGEKLSARVSYYELTIDGEMKEKQKSSGLMVCAGTGSTSWYFNSNNITKSTVKQILSIAQRHKCVSNANITDDRSIGKIVKDFNNALMFGAEEEKMAYSVRDPLSRGVYLVSSESRGFCKWLKVKSRMYDACIVVDGGQSYSFNDGASVELSIQPEDALLCIKMHE